MSAAKIIKIPDGDAYIEIGKDYVRIGAGPDNFIILDKSVINASAQSVNFQMSPDKMTFHGLLSNITPVAGALPFTPTYFFSETIINAFANVAINSAIIAGATSIVGI